MLDLMLKALGRLMFATPLIAIFVSIGLMQGWSLAIGLFLSAGLLLGWTFLACYLMDR